MLLSVTVMYAFPQQRLGNFIVYGKENGLSQSSYHDVFESSNGYLWLGSSNGLFRFDGKRFNQIISWYNTPNSPGDNNIVDLEEDNHGNLWMAGFTTGLTKYNLKTGKFRQYKRLSKDSTSAYGIFCITKDDKGELWIGTSGRGLAKYLPDKDTFAFFYPNQKKTKDGSVYGENVVTGIVQDTYDKDLLWLSCFDGLYLFNKKTNAFTFYDPAYTGNYEKPAGLKTLLCIEQSGNKLFFGTWFAGLVVFDKINKSFARIVYNRPGKTSYLYGILDMQLVADSLLYLAAMNDGLLCYNLRSQKIDSVITQPDIDHFNTEINIQRVSITPHAGFFAGGNTAIYQLQSGPKHFEKSINFSFKNKTPLKATKITSAIYDSVRKGYWCSFLNYPVCVFYGENNFTQKEFPITGKENWFTELAIDGSGMVWAVAHNDGLFYLNQVTERFEPVAGNLSNKQLKSTNDFETIKADSKGNLWIAGRSQVLHYNVANKKITEFSIPLNDVLKNSRRGIRFLTLKVDSKNNAWMSTNSGLFFFELSMQKSVYYFNNLNAGPKPASTVIKSMAIDKDDHIWLGYFNEGIQVIDPGKGSIVKSFGMDDGLPSAEINYMACDTKNNILACLHNGLSVYRKATGSWQTIDALNGLKRDYLDMGVFALNNGKIILDQHNSFLVFNTDSLWAKPDSSFLHINAIKINGQNWYADALPDHINSLVLPSVTNDIQIEFSATNWQFPLRTKYFYRVNGIHKTGEWYPANEALVNLTGLASGNYKFMFYAVTSDGTTTSVRNLFIKIKPPYYKTWWFILLAVLFTAFVIYSFFRYRINQLKKLHEMRNSISRNLHDDIGASLSNISILNELARRNAPDNHKLRKYLDKAGEDIQRTSEDLGDIVWNINPAFDDLQNLFIRMRRYAADMTEGRNINCIISLPGQAENIKMEMIKRRNLYLIFKEAVNNMAKYSEAANGTINIEIKNNELLMQIKDDGKGFDNTIVKTGNGLTNMKQRAGICNGTLQIISAPGKGTVICLTMPI